MRTRSDELLGTEYDWLASDADGRVALFSTAGGAVVPNGFLGSVDQHDRAIDAILQLAPTTSELFAPTLAPGLDNTWAEVARRGLFAYVSDAHGGPYRLVAAPTNPAHLSSLPESVRQVAEKLKFAHLSFAQTDTIPAATIRAHGNPERSFIKI